MLTYVLFLYIYKFIFFTFQETLLYHRLKNLQCLLLVCHLDLLMSHFSLYPFKELYNMTCCMVKLARGYLTLNVLTLQESLAQLPAATE